MDIATLQRPGTADRTSATATPHRVSRWGVAVGVAAVLAAAVWSLAVPQGVSPAGPGELGLVGGVVHVDGVVSAARPRHAMPGMGSDDDPVADDERRVSVDVTLRADEDDSLEYAAERFRLSPENGAALTPHRLVLPGEELPPGTQLSGTLIFDVPKEARSATLSYEESATQVVLPEEAAGAAPSASAPAPSGAHGAGHG